MINMVCSLFKQTLWLIDCHKKSICTSVLPERGTGSGVDDSLIIIIVKPAQQAKDGQRDTMYNILYNNKVTQLVAKCSQSKPTAAQYFVLHKENAYITEWYKTTHLFEECPIELYNIPTIVASHNYVQVH